MCPDKTGRGTEFISEETWCRFTSCCYTTEPLKRSSCFWLPSASSTLSTPTSSRPSRHGNPVAAGSPSIQCLLIARALHRSPRASDLELGHRGHGGHLPWNLTAGPPSTRQRNPGAAGVWPTLKKCLKRLVRCLAQDVVASRRAGIDCQERGCMLGSRRAGIESA